MHVGNVGICLIAASVALMQSMCTSYISDLRGNTATYTVNGIGDLTEQHTSDVGVTTFRYDADDTKNAGEIYQMTL